MAGASSSRDHARPVELRERQTVLEERVDLLTNEIDAKDKDLEMERELRKTLERQLGSLRQTGVEATAELLVNAAGLDAAELVRKDARENEIHASNPIWTSSERSQRGNMTT